MAPRTQGRQALRHADERYHRRANAAASGGS
jgi:hypothetical protein